MRSHLGGGQDKEAVIGYWPNAAIGLVRNAGEQWLASPPGPAKPGQEAMARQITDWLCFGIAPELQTPAHGPELPGLNSTCQNQRRKRHD